MCDKIIDVAVGTGQAMRSGVHVSPSRWHGVKPLPQSAQLPWRARSSGSARGCACRPRPRHGEISCEALVQMPVDILGDVRVKWIGNIG